MEDPCSALQGLHRAKWTTLPNSSQLFPSLTNSPHLTNSSHLFPSHHLSHLVHLYTSLSHFIPMEIISSQIPSEQRCFVCVRTRGGLNCKFESTSSACMHCIAEKTPCLFLVEPKSLRVPPQSPRLEPAARGRRIACPKCPRRSFAPSTLQRHWTTRRISSPTSLSN